MNADVYEPWQPQIGQRVRVRISAECPIHAEVQQYVRWYASDGKAGTVTADRRVPNPGLSGPLPEYREAHQRAIASGHWWRVEMDEAIGVSNHGFEIGADLMCAIELEPIQ